MKRTLVLMALFAVLLQATLVFAQDSYFPIGALLGRNRLRSPESAEPLCSPLAMVDSAKKCGFNLVSIGGMYDGSAVNNMLSTALDHIKAREMKCLVMQAPKLSASSATVWIDNKYNIERFASGIYRRFEAEDHPYFIHPGGGYNNGTAWVCEPGADTVILYRDLTSEPYWDHRNCSEAWMPFVDTLFNTQWQHYGRTEYRATFRLMYQNEDPLDNTVPGSPVSVCRIAFDTVFTQNWDSSFTVDCDTITTADFAGPNQWKTFTLKHTRLAGQTRYLDFPVYTYGNKRLFIDYVEMHDAVYDSLSNDYNNTYSEAINNIANYYSGPTSSYQDVVYRYYMYDEPMRSQLEAYKLVNEQLKNVNANVPGLTWVCPKYPTSYGAYADSGLADTTFYGEFVNTTSPAQLAVDILPLFGDSGKAAIGDVYCRTPQDSGYYFQKQLDILCMYSRAAQRASSSAGIPWWIQVQCCGDSLYDLSGQNTGIEGRWRLPSPREIKCMVNLGLAHGAKGIFYYNFSEGWIDYSAYGKVAPKVWRQFGVVDTAGGIRDTALYNAVKQTNERIAQWAPTLLNLDYDHAFKCNDGVPSGSCITYLSDSLVQVGLFHSSANINDKYFMLVNRHCLPTDTLTVTININSTEPFFISDILTGQPASGQLPAGTNVPFSYKLQPGEGRLFRIVPFTAQIKINQNAAYTNFRFVQVEDPASSSLHTVDSVQITQKYYVKTPEDTAARPDYIDYYWAADTSPWLPYSASYIKYLENSIDNKANIFEIQFKIGGGKILTPKYSSQIFFNDASPANGSISINNGDTFTNSQTVNVKLSGDDLFPGLAQMRYAENPFGNPIGYVNLVQNGCFDDTTRWVLDNAEYYGGFLHLKGYNSGPGPAQFGSSAKQIIPGSEINPHRNKLFRLTDDIYSHNVISSYKYVDVFYADSLSPNGVRLLDKSIASTPEVVWKSSTDTFTLKVDTARPLDRIEISYNIFGIELPPPSPDPGTLFNTIAVDNIRLEPVELKTGALPDNVPQNTYVFDGWDYADTNYSWYYDLSQDDGTKRVYLQLRDLPGNISTEPGWYDEIILDMTLPYSNITLPLTASYINGFVNAYGLYSDLNYDKWILDYKPYSYGDWQELTRSGVNQIDFNPGNLLYTWDTGTLHDGTYLLRLTTYDKASNVKADTHFVYVVIEPALPISAVTSEFATFNSLPVDATCDNFGNVYVTDTQADKIWKFSPEGDSLLCFGYNYTGQDTLGLNHPKGIAVDDSGNIWITDCYQSKVKKYDSQGNYLSTIGKHGNQQGEFNQPTGIAISGNEIYVVDHLNGRVQVFNKTGAFNRQFGNNCLNQPAGIAIRNNDAEKLVYVCDTQNDRIAIFDTEGNLVNSLDSLGLDKPWDICFDNNNNLYIADVYHNRVIELDPWHNKLLTFGIQGQEAGQFKLPQGLAVSPDGKYLYVADTHNDRLQRFKMFFDMGALGGPQTSGKRQITNSAPTVFGLSQCYPNPCKQATNINYQIANTGYVSLKVYNTLGQVIKTIVNQNHLPGYYSIKWNGKDDNDRKVSSGIYFYRIVSGEFNDTKKMVILN